MYPEMCRQVAGQSEFLAADLAGVGAVTGMRSHVFRQVAGVREGLAADGAGAGAGAGMGAHVLGQGA